MIVERVTAIADALTPAEQKLVRELLSRPREAALGTASELANRIGVHEATASRLARKLGYETYGSFRDAIRQEFLRTTEPATRLRNTLASAQGASILGSIVDQEVAGLRGLASYVSDARLAAAAAALSAARKVFVFAQGNARALSVMMDRRLRRMGVDAVLLAGDARDLAERVLAMTGEDALLAFAFRRAPSQYRPLVEHCRGIAAASVAVTDLVGPSLAPAPDHLLFAPRAGMDDAFQTLTVPMAVGNALILHMAADAGERPLRHLEALGALIARFDRR